MSKIKWKLKPKRNQIIKKYMLNIYKDIRLNETPTKIFVVNFNQSNENDV